MSLVAMTSHDRHGVSNHQHVHCVFHLLLKHTSKKTPKLCATSEGKPPVNGGFPLQRTSNAERISIWWRLHENVVCRMGFISCRPECLVPASNSSTLVIHFIMYPALQMLLFQTTKFCMVSTKLALHRFEAFFLSHMTAWKMMSARSRGKSNVNAQPV